MNNFITNEIFSDESRNERERERGERKRDNEKRNNERKKEKKERERELSRFPLSSASSGASSSLLPVGSTPENIYFHYLTILSANNWPGIPAISAITALTGFKYQNNRRIYTTVVRVWRGLSLNF